MPRFIEGQDRQQVTLMPECLDDFIADDNPVRVIDAFVGELDLASMGFDRAEPSATGRDKGVPHAGSPIVGDNERRSGRAARAGK